MSMENKIGMQALAGLMGSHPLIRTGVKYWWAVIPAGFAMWGLMRERPKITIGGVLQDFSTSFGPMITLIMLAEFVEANSKRATPVGGLSPAPRDVQFTVQPKPAGPRMAPGPIPGTTPNFPTPQAFPAR